MDCVDSPLINKSGEFFCFLIAHRLAHIKMLLRETTRKMLIVICLNFERLTSFFKTKNKKYDFCRVLQSYFFFTLVAIRYLNVHLLHILPKNSNITLK